MKIPLAYPKIPDTTNCPLKQCIVFDKLDGTNVIFYRNREGEWYAFGTRRDKFPLHHNGIKEFNIAHPGLEEASEIFDASDFDNNGKELTLFFEFLGENSFAGQHQKNDPKKLVLIDVSVDGKILPPEDFINYSSKLEFEIPNIIYRGKYSGQLIEDIRKGNTKEGAVIKGVVDGRVYMCKQKTDAYINRLKTEFKDGWEQYI
jgi:RNA ligase-like protein